MMTLSGQNTLTRDKPCTLTLNSPYAFANKVFKQYLAQKVSMPFIVVSYGGQTNVERKPCWRVAGRESKKMDKTRVIDEFAEMWHEMDGKN